MKTVKSELQGELCSLILLAFSKKSLKKVVLSKPDATDEIKSVISQLPPQDIAILKTLYNPEVARQELTDNGQRMIAILD